MGDFNCSWEKGSALRVLAEALGLTAYRADAADLVTFPTTKKRLDWILISKELEFVAYRAIPDIVSDHLGVVSEVRRRRQPEPTR